MDQLTDQYFALQGFYQSNPKAFANLTDEEFELLRDVYFIDREVGEDDDVDAHMQKRLQEDPGLPKKLQPILKKVADDIKLEEKAQKHFLFEEL